MTCRGTKKSLTNVLIITHQMNTYTCTADHFKLADKFPQLNFTFSPSRVWSNFPVVRSKMFIIPSMAPHAI